MPPTAYRAALDLVTHRARAPLPDQTAARSVRRVGIIAGWLSPRPTGRSARAVLTLAVGLVALSALAGCDGDSTSGATPAAAKPSLGAEVVQELRRDVVLQRVEVTVENHGDSDVMVERLGLSVPGFQIPGPLRKDEPLLAGSVVNLPVPYDAVCGARPTVPRGSERPG